MYSIYSLYSIQLLSLLHSYILRAPLLTQKNQKDKEIQQPGFAGGHPTTYRSI